MATATPSTPYELAKAYNALPRSPKTPSGKVDNRWVAKVRRVTLHPPGLVLHLVNPGSRYVHTEKLPVGPDTLEQPEKLAVGVALALLKAFVEGLMNPDTPVALHDRPKAFGAWQLAMFGEDATLAKHVERQLKGLGVDKERRTFDTATRDEERISDDNWQDLMRTLERAVAV